MIDSNEAGIPSETEVRFFLGEHTYIAIIGEGRDKRKVLISSGGAEVGEGWAVRVGTHRYLCHERRQ